MSTETIHVAGRYNKYLRNLSQSPWFDKNDCRVMDSVQEMLEDGLKKYLQFEKTTFASSGREDVDVRMLGKGRPFAFRLHNPQSVDDYNNETLKKVQEFINVTHKGKVFVRDLQMVTKLDVAKNLKEGQESKTKEYRALCCCSRKITPSDIEKINCITDLRLEQMTPIRVLHRRTWATRQRTIHRLKIEPVQVGEFESVKPEILDNVFAVTLLTEAGTYIKEFVHGDFGRTEPNLSSLLGDCDTDLMELDVMEVHANWPPALGDHQLETKEQVPSTASLAHQGDKMDCGDEALADLYLRGHKAMQDALTAERGDAKESLLVDARRSLERAITLTETLALFSDNETVEDIATVNLKYLLLPAYLARVSISGDIGSRRLEAFTRAENYVKQFLQRIAAYSLGAKRVEEVLKSIDEPAGPKVPSSLEEQALSRAEKIERYNQAKELETRLAELERRLKSGQEVDDEVARDYYISLVNKWINDVFDDYNGIVRPALMFERGGPQARQDPEPPKPKPSDSLEGKTFVITKDQLKKDVFGTGYPALPSLSVDQFITKKINDGELAFQSQKEIYANSLQRYAEQPDLRREQEEQSDEEREAKEEREDLEELAKKRRWDEFKDENPRGSGNRHNMG